MCGRNGIMLIRLVYMIKRPSCLTLGGGEHLRFFKRVKKIEKGGVGGCVLVVMVKSPSELQLPGEGGGGGVWYRRLNDIRTS